MTTETKTNTTPGPWTTKDSTQVYSGGRHIADCGSRNPKGLPRHIGLEDAANAKLIASAPVMLGALKECDHILTHLADGDIEEGGHDSAELEMERIIKKTRAIIATATK